MAIKLIQNRLHNKVLLDFSEKAVFYLGVCSLVDPVEPSDLVTKSYVDSCLSKLTTIDSIVEDTALLDGKDSSYYTDIDSRLGFKPQDSYAKGRPNGYLDLDTAGLVPHERMPKDLVQAKEYSSTTLFPKVGSSDTIYLDTTTNLLYRYSSNGYIQLGGILTTTNEASTLKYTININSTPFNGSSDITTNIWGNYKQVTIGNKSNYINGEKDYTYSSYDIISYNTVSKSGDKITGPLLITNTPTTNLSIVNKDYVDNIVKQRQLFPVGGMIPYDHTSVVPDGFLRCNGALVDKESYCNLYSVIGDDYRITPIISGGKPWESQYLISYETKTISNISPTFLFNSYVDSQSSPIDFFKWDFNSQSIVYCGSDGYIYHTYIKPDTTIPRPAKLFNYSEVDILQGSLILTNKGIYTLGALTSVTNTNTSKMYTYTDYVSYFKEDGGIYDPIVLSSYTNKYNLTQTINDQTFQTTIRNHTPNVKIKTTNKLYIISSRKISDITSNQTQPSYIKDVYHSYSYDIDPQGGLSGKRSYPHFNFSTEQAGSCNNIKFAYLVGCYVDESNPCSVKVATISGGVLESFVDTTSIPDINDTNYNFNNRCCIVNNTLYAINSNNVMYYASINKDGTISSWNSYKLPFFATSPIPYFYNNKLYLIGNQVATLSVDSSGMFSSLKCYIDTQNKLTNPNRTLLFTTKDHVYLYDNTLNTMLVSSINQDGTISGLFSDNSIRTLNMSNESSSIISYIVANNSLLCFRYVDGKILRIPINSDGTIGDFDTSIEIPGNINPGVLCPDQCFYVDGYVYLIGCSNYMLSNTGTNSYYSYVKNASIWSFRLKEDNSVDNITSLGSLPVKGNVLGIIYTTKKIHIFITKDFSDSNSQVLIYSCNIKPKGKLGVWVRTGIFPTNSYGNTKMNFYTTTYNAYTVYKSRLYTTTINPDTSLGSWVDVATVNCISGKFISTSSKVYFLCNGSYITDIKGSIGDFSEYYDPQYYSNKKTTKFRLPNSTDSINPNLGFIIKT